MPEVAKGRCWCLRETRGSPSRRDLHRRNASRSAGHRWGGYATRQPPPDAGKHQRRQRPQSAPHVSRRAGGAVQRPLAHRLTDKPAQRAAADAPRAERRSRAWRRESPNATCRANSAACRSRRRRRSAKRQPARDAPGAQAAPGKAASRLTRHQLPTTQHGLG